MKRIGYIGLSTPTFYDYANRATVAKADLSSSPNPVIEGAFGSILLYDELWFFSRSLCPENMRKLPYVKFLDEIGMAPAINPEFIPPADDFFCVQALNRYNSIRDSYEETRAKTGIYWKAAADNHTHSLEINGHHYSGNCWSAENVITDLTAISYLPKNVELITNTYTSKLFYAEADTSKKLELTELLILENVPQFLTPLGPYHPCVDEVRESGFLSDFRKWMTSEAANATALEVREIKEEVEAKLAESQRDIFLKHIQRRGGYIAFTETAASLALDLADCITSLPLLSAGKDLIKQYREEKEKQSIRWQGFLLEARQRVRSK
jgi:hypothetical protein